jgi:glycerol-3-phosphate acyltransferase PlsY
MLSNSLLIILAYLIGSISGAIIATKLMALPDPRTQGSGNPGATNVLRHGGKKAALFTLSIDILKGIIAVLIVKLITIEPIILAAATLAVFLGHLYPIFFQFKGGKGVATAFAALLILAWPVALAALFTWIIMALVFRYSSLSAIMAAIITPISMFWLTPYWEYTLVSFIICGFLLWRHRSNIKNLWNGTEDKIGQPQGIAPTT